MTRDPSLDIAVTGIAARFPGASQLSDWWTAVLEGKVLTTRLERAEVLARGVPERLLTDDWVPVVAEVPGADRFDHEFFGLSAREAQLMDPQHRLALEISWQALEDAAVVPGQDARRTAVFTSMTGSGYLRSFLRAADPDPALLDDLIHGCEPEFLASRVAYKLGLRGPAIAVQTACSSSLVGVHLAVQALLGGDCDQAVVVGTGMSHPGGGYQYQPGGILSADGACRPFSASANGVVGGHGAAAIVLRRAEDLGADDPRPHGVILGSATNNDGSTKAGYYAPSPEGQRQVIHAALTAADIDPRTVGHLQTHGTGTALGDPIEWQAASAAYRERGAQPGQIAIGAVKANVGHLDACAGLAGLITAILAARDGHIPPVAGYDAPSPQLELESSPLRVPTTHEAWTGAGPRRAAVSAFGIGGTNAHVIVEEPPAPASEPVDERPVVLALSAADQSALVRMKEGLAAALETQPAPRLADAAHTLVAGRATFGHRVAVVAAGRRDAAAALRSAATPPRAVGAAQPVIAVFPGQGTQTPGMAVPYLAALPGLHELIEECLDELEHLGEEGTAGRAEVRAALCDESLDPQVLNQTSLAQPAIACLQLALVDLVRGLGVTPSVSVGHSLGEIAAAYTSGALSRSEAVRFSARRGAAMQACPTGSMLALGCSAEEAEAHLQGTSLDLAAVNGPASCVVAGTPEAVQALAEELPRGVFRRVLTTTRAFHSRLIEPSLDALAEASTNLARTPLTSPLVSASDAVLLGAGEHLSGSFWLDAARRPVRFADALRVATASVTDAVLLEVGPGRALSPLLEELGLATCTIGVPPKGGPSHVLEGVADLWANGVDVDLRRLTGDGRLEHLPAYPFEGPVHVAAELAHRESTGPAESVAEPAEVSLARPDPEVAMREAWTSLLGRDALQPHDDFFDLGGDSLLVIRLIRALDAAVGIRLSPRDLLSARTLEAQVLVLDRALVGS